MAVADRVHELARLKVAAMRNDVRQQRVACNVERDTKTCHYNSRQSVVTAQVVTAQVVKQRIQNKVPVNETYPCLLIAGTSEELEGNANKRKQAQTSANK